LPSSLFTAGFTSNTLKLYTRNTIPNYAYHYYLQHLQQLKSFKQPADFVKTFSLGEEDWAQFLQTALQDSINLSGTLPAEKADIINRITAAVARQLWRNEGMYESLNKNDAAVKKAIEIIAK
jgi:carboxyl-terminal processing protease